MTKTNEMNYSLYCINKFEVKSNILWLYANNVNFIDILPNEKTEK